MEKRRRYSPDTTCIEQLPDDVLIFILSFLTDIREIARTSILSRRWRNLWLGTTCLDFDPTALLPIELLSTQMQDCYIAWVNKVIEARVASPQFPPLKKLQIWYELDESQRHHIDRWIKFAVSKPLETLHLQFRPPYAEIVLTSDQYKLSIDPWYNAPCGLSNLRCLKSLHLWSVNVSKQFIEFILSSCPLLEDLSLIDAGTFKDLDISGSPPLRLRQLEIEVFYEPALSKLCAPYLTSFRLYSDIFSPHNIDVPMLTDLSIGGIHSPCIINCLGHFWSYLPQLERLELHMFKPQSFKLERMPELVKVKYLKISINWDSNSVFDEILNFTNACPLLETLTFEILNGEELRRPRRRRKEKIWRKAAKMNCCFKCLKVLEVLGGDGKAIDQEVVKIIISKAPNLAKLIVRENYMSDFPTSRLPTPRMVRKLGAKAKASCEGRLGEINITIVA